MKRYAIWIIVLLLSLIFMSSRQSIEISNRALIHAVGIDKTDDEYTITLQVFNSNGSGSGDTPVDPTKPNTKTITNTAPTFSEAMALCENQLGNYLFFGHNQVIVLGHDTDFSDPQELLSYFIRNKDNFLGVNIVLAENTAQELLNAKIQAGTVTIENFKEVIDMYNDKGETPHCDMVHFLNESMKPDNSVMLPIISVRQSSESADSSGGNSQSSGSDDSSEDNSIYEIKESAVVSDGRIVGTLTPQQVSCINLLTNKTNNSMINIDFNGTPLGLALHKKTADTSLNADDQKLVYQSDISVTANLENNIFTTEDRKNISTLVEQELSRQCNEVFDKVLNEYNADVLGIYCMTKHYFPKIFLQYKDDIQMLKSNTKLKISVDCITQ